MDLRNASLGPRISAPVSAGRSVPPWVNRSPHSSVLVLSSLRNPHSQAWGRWGVSYQRTACVPSASTSPSASARGSLSARSAIDTMAATCPHSGVACGATASHSLSEPHSSASTWEKPMWRRLATGRTVATASRTSGNSLRGPVWNSSGSSSTMRYWLKEKPVVPASGTGVLIRKIPAAISYTLVPLWLLLIIMALLPSSPVNSPQ